MLEANHIELSEEGWQRLSQGYGDQDFGKGIEWLRNTDAPSLDDRRRDLAKSMAMAAMDSDSIKAPGGFIPPTPKFGGLQRRSPPLPGPSRFGIGIVVDVRRLDGADFN